ncbi:Protein of unknown function [Halanaerobium congolense]|jgi:hypothetical protein|uniref:DUF3010 family protein n=1 Tax=Halanaerobium congolense TaxID=54121 RepID=A0A1G8SYE0_9FIRM|nr:DUF3010 family protein [Halanaerobium congolense]SDJ34186.1 Protein of unknown function [Halanaerobium congolense]SET85970.1 Protein of unknown function [Halanaerobium congolense]
MSKNVCGIQIKGSEAIFIILTGNKSDFEICNTAFNKLELEDSTQQSQIHSFRQAVSSLFKNHNISKLGIKSRPTGGKVQGGAASFIIEGIIQTLDTTAEIIHYATLASYYKKNPYEVKKHDIYKYQYDAFKVAYYLLEE